MSLLQHAGSIHHEQKVALKSAGFHSFHFLSALSISVVIILLSFALSIAAL